MQVAVENTGSLERKVHVEVPEEKIEGEVYNRLQSLSRTTKISGFRPGKAPKAMIKKRYASEIKDQVQQEIVRQAMGIVFEDNDLIPLTNPEMNQGLLGRGP